MEYKKYTNSDLLRIWDQVKYKLAISLAGVITVVSPNTASATPQVNGKTNN